MTRLTPTWIAAVLLLGMISSAHALLPPPDTLRGVQDMVREAVAKVRPSVVAVRAQKQELAPGGGEMWFESVGSGIVVDQDGHVLTNSHVVRGASRISVVFWDQPDRVFTARVTDDDPDNDLALLLVESGPALHPAPLGHASTLGIGQWVVSVGSPYGYDHSASLGIISGLHRNLNIDGVRYRDMIQTDAVINQGSSGGPLINANGRVVGINTAVFSPDNAYAGISFAIPINRAKQFLSRTLGAVPTVAAATMPSPGPSPATPGNAQGPAATGFQPLPAIGSGQGQGTAAQAPAQPVGPIANPQAWNPLPGTLGTVAGTGVGTSGGTGQNRAGFQPLPMTSPVQGGASSAPLGAAAAMGAIDGGPVVPLDGTVMDVFGGTGGGQTGSATTAAATQKAKTPIDMNMRIPKDATHKKFSDCRSCHDITKKSPANTNLPMPHEPLAGCDGCHVMITEKVAAGPTTVGWTVLSQLPGGQGITRSDVLICLIIGLAAMLALAASVDSGLLFMPVLLAFGYDPRLAAAASLILVAVCGLATMVRHSGTGLLDRRLFGMVGPAAFIGAFAGGFTAGQVNPGTLTPVLAGTLLCAALLMLRDPELAEAWGGRDEVGGLAWRAEYRGETYIVELFSAVLLTAACAFLGGALGVAGTWALVPLAMSFYRLPLVPALVMAGAMLPFAGLGGYLGHAVNGSFDPPLLAPLAMTAMGGAVAGMLFAPLGRRSAGRLLAALALGAAGVWMILRLAGVM